jgi:hypothetical protein
VTITDDDELDDVDWDALQRAFKLCAAKSPAHAEQLETKLAYGEPWADVAAFAASCVQSDTLHLALYQHPPCRVDIEGPLKEWDRGARVLLKRLLAADLSCYEPDPLQALQRKRKRK